MRAHGVDGHEHVVLVVCESAAGVRREGVRAAQVVPLTGSVPDRRAALVGLPPLLRSYLGLGGWVGDHAVIDKVMNTVHVFTALSVDAVPAARARALRALAG